MRHMEERSEVRRTGVRGACHALSKNLPSPLAFSQYLPTMWVRGRKRRGGTRVRNRIMRNVKSARTFFVSSICSGPCFPRSSSSSPGVDVGDE